MGRLRRRPGSMAPSLVVAGIVLLLGSGSAQVGGRASMIAQDGELARQSPGWYGLPPHANISPNGGNAFPFVDNNAEGDEPAMWQPAGVACGLKDCADPCPEPCPCDPCGKQYVWQWGDDDVPWGSRTKEKPHVEHGKFFGYPEPFSPTDGYHHRWGPVLDARLPVAHNYLDETLINHRGCYRCNRSNSDGNDTDNVDIADAAGPTRGPKFGSENHIEVAEIIVTLGLNYEYVVKHRKAFDHAFRSDIAFNLPGLDKSGVVVTSFSAGSVVVDFFIYNYTGAAFMLMDKLVNNTIAMPETKIFNGNKEITISDVQLPGLDTTKTQENITDAIMNKDGTHLFELIHDHSIFNDENGLPQNFSKAVNLARSDDIEKAHMDVAAGEVTTGERMQNSASSPSPLPENETDTLYAPQHNSSSAENREEFKPSVPARPAGWPDHMCWPPGKLCKEQNNTADKVPKPDAELKRADSVPKNAGVLTKQSTTERSTADSDGAEKDSSTSDPAENSVSTSVSKAAEKMALEIPANGEKLKDAKASRAVEAAASSKSIDASGGRAATKEGQGSNSAEPGASALADGAKGDPRERPDRRR